MQGFGQAVELAAACCGSQALTLDPVGSSSGDATAWAPRRAIRRVLVGAARSCATHYCWTPYRLRPGSRTSRRAVSTYVSRIPFRSAGTGFQVRVPSEWVGSGGSGGGTRMVQLEPVRAAGGAVDGAPRSQSARVWTPTKTGSFRHFSPRH